MAFNTLKGNLIPQVISRDKNTNFDTRAVVDGFIGSLVVAAESLRDFGGFQLDKTTLKKLTIENDFADEVLPSRKVISQHVVTKPIQFTVSGYLYDNYIQGDIIDEVIDRGAESLGVISTYTPDMTDSAIELYTKVDNVIRGGLSYVDRAISSGRQLANALSIAKNTGEKRTTSNLRRLHNLALEKVPLNIAFLDQEYQDFIIQSIDSTHEKDIHSERVQVEISFRQVFVTTTKFTTLAKKEIDNKIQSQRAKTTQKGTSVGKEKRAGALFNLIGEDVRRLVN